MSECSVVRERMPLLLTETLDVPARELTHQHIEQCSDCSAEWDASRLTWQILGELPELPVPARVKNRFLEEAGIASPAPVADVVPFRRRNAVKWIAQAATIAVLAGGSYFAGRQTATETSPAALPMTVQAPFRITDNAVLPASAVSPDIQGKPDIANVQFIEKGSEIGMSFDLTSRVTVTGAPNDKNMVRLLSYVLQNRESTESPSNAIQWVRDQYSQSGTADPEIVKALASLLKTDSHEGVRIKAVDALSSLPAQAAPEVRAVLVEALRNDPNPAVRIKAVEALANLARSNNTLDPSTLDTLREKASQQDENAYVRVKAAEALSQLNL